MQPATRPAISASVSGVSTTNGYSTRQSVASVTCETRDMPSNLMLSLAVTRERTRTVRLRRSQTARNCAANASTALRDSASSSPTTASRAASAAGVRRFSTSPRRWCSASISWRAPARVVEQVVLQVRIALHDPDVAEHLVQHARRAAGAALAAQQAEHLPGARAEQADDDLAVGERGVVVGNLAQARRARRLLLLRRLIRSIGSGAFMEAGRSSRPPVRGARHRTAAQQIVSLAARSAPCAAGIPACRRAPAARDKRGCHLGPRQSRRSDRPPRPLLTESS